MREICTYGSEGGGIELNRSFLPLSGVAGMARSYKLGATGFSSAMKARAAFDSVRSR